MSHCVHLSSVGPAPLRHLSHRHSQFDLTEVWASAGDASPCAKVNDPVDFAEKIAELIENPEARNRMGKLGCARLPERLNLAIRRRIGRRSTTGPLRRWGVKETGRGLPGPPFASMEPVRQLCADGA